MENTLQPVGSIWKNRTFTRMFTAFSLSTLGDWFDMLAMQVLFAYVWNADPMVIALMPLTFAVPGLLFGQIAGVLADRWKKLNLMIVTDLLCGVLTVLLLLAPNPYWALVVLLFRSAVACFNTPAQQSLTRYVVSEEHLLKANSLNGLMNQIGKVVGPLVGGALLAVISPKVCIEINAVSFILSGIVLLTIGKIAENRSAVESDENKAPKQSFRESWREGWAIVLKKRILFGSLIFGILAGLAIQLVDFQFSVALKAYSPDNTSILGWCVASIGLGSVCIIMYLKNKKDIQSYGFYIGIGTMLLSLMFGGIGYLEPGYSVVIPLAVTFISGIGNGINAIVGSYVFQKEAPPESLGRIYGIQGTVFSGVMLISPLLGGLLIDTFGVQPTFKYIGFFLFFCGVVALLFRNVIWKRDVQTQPVASSEVSA